MKPMTVVHRKACCRMHRVGAAVTSFVLLAVLASTLAFLGQPLFAEVSAHGEDPAPTSVAVVEPPPSGGAGEPTRPVRLEEGSAEVLLGSWRYTSGSSGRHHGSFH